MPPASPRTVWIHPQAPAKPAVGQPCNGCGVCCLAEPCPVGMVLSLKRRGACRRLRWDEQQGIYRCGLLAARSPGARAGWLARGLARAAARWIAAGQGCDAHFDVTPSDMA